MKIKYETGQLNNFFAPRSLAFLGASENIEKWGYVILNNIVLGGYEGRLYPVNPRGGQIGKLKVYKSLKEIAEVPELAVIVVPPAGIIKAVRECGEKGIKAGVVITAGFAEVGEMGAALQEEMVGAARSYGMRLIGPNCFGIMSPSHKLYAQMPFVYPPAGPVAVVSQSGNVGFTIARHATTMDQGCSKVISTGNEADLHTEDFIEYLSDDDESSVILCYLEGLKDGRRFFDIAGRASQKKPVIMIKAGETGAGVSAAWSHTASLTGADAVFDGVCRQTGIIRVHNLQELINVSHGFICHPLPAGNRIGIVTQGGGWGVLAADACSKLGLDVVKLPEKILKELDQLLPLWWSRNNPVDLVAGSPPDGMPVVIEKLLAYSGIDAVVALGFPEPDIVWNSVVSGGQDSESKTAVAIQLLTASFCRVKDISLKYGKPVVFAAEVPVLHGDLRFQHRVARTLSRQNMVCYNMPHQAAHTLSCMVRYSRFLQSHR